jgi:hypothetical protein
MTVGQLIMHTMNNSTVLIGVVKGGQLGSSHGPTTLLQKREATLIAFLVPVIL